MIHRKRPKVDDPKWTCQSGRPKALDSKAESKTVLVNNFLPFSTSFEPLVIWTHAWTFYIHLDFTLWYWDQTWNVKVYCKTGWKVITTYVISLMYVELILNWQANSGTPFTLVKLVNPPPKLKFCLKFRFWIHKRKKTWIRSLRLSLNLGIYTMIFFEVKFILALISLGNNRIA